MQQDCYPAATMCVCILLRVLSQILLSSEIGGPGIVKKRVLMLTVLEATYLCRGTGISSDLLDLGKARLLAGYTNNWPIAYILQGVTMSITFPEVFTQVKTYLYTQILRPKD